MYLDLNLNETLGPALIGTIFALMLFGLSCAQVMYYVCEYPKDKLLLKGLVTILWLLDAGATIVDTVIVWHYTVTSRNNVFDLAKLFNVASAEYALAVPTIFIVQCYYIYTIWILLGQRPYKWPLTIFMSFLTLSSFILGYVNVNFSVHHPSFPAVFSEPRDLAILQTLGAVLADICTTTSLILILNGQKTGIKATDRLVQKLTIYAVNRGGLITVVQTTQFITYIALQKDSLYWVMFHLPGSKIYFNSFLAVLNARHSLGANDQKYLSNGFSLMEFPVDPPSSNENMSSRLSSHVQV